MSDDFKAQVTMVRNFPSHVGGYDAELPEKKCCEGDYHGQCCFRDGWACAVEAINARITEMQNNRLRSESESRLCLFPCGIFAAILLLTLGDIISSIL